MGNEVLVQALIRLVVIFVTAGLAAVGANLTILKDAVSDPIMAAAVVAIITAVISAVGKYLGGATAPAPVTHGEGAAPAARPNVLAV